MLIPTQVISVNSQLSALLNYCFNYWHEITYSVSILYGVHGNNGGVKSTKNSPSIGLIMRQRVLFGR